MGRAARRLQRAAGDGFVLGATKPSAQNTGLRNPATLTVYNGDITVTTAGTVIENLDIYGTVSIRTADVTVRNCRIRGKPFTLPATPVQYLVECRHGSCVNARIEHCELRSDYDNYLVTGIIGHDYTAHRNNIYQVVDGLGIYKTQDPGGPVNVTLTGNYVHDLIYYTEAGVGAPVHPSDTQTHNDCLQIQGGSNTLVYGNNFQGFFSTTMGQNAGRPQANAAIQYNNNVGATTAMTVQRNWLDGGGSSINGGSTAGTNIGEISSNKFGHNQAQQGGGYNDTVAIVLTPTTTCVTANNVYEDNGIAVTTRYW